MSRKNLSMKKGQAALEFMATYGWAILIILVAMGTLAYFGFTNPQKTLPDKCIFGNGLVCQDSIITNTTINMTIYNSVGKTIYEVNATPDGFSATCTTLPNISVSGDVPIKVDCKLTTALTKNDRKKFKFTVYYEKVLNGYKQVSSGEIYGAVQ